MKELKRVFHPCETWEEMDSNMWGGVTDRALYLKKAIDFTSDHKKYGRYMRAVIEKWPVSCENHLTNLNINRKAWLGHAAVALALECPEDITREAWGKLTDEQRFLANKEAARTIQIWEYNYTESKDVYRDMGGEMLF